MIDWSSLLYGPIYSSLGVSATFTPLTGVAIPGLKVIDKTAGVEVDGSFSNIQIGTIRPACDVRMSELTDKAIALDTLKDASITFNGNTWRVKTHQMRPGPDGEGAGEVRLILLDENAT